MADSPPSDHASASPSASTRARTSRRMTNIPDKFGIISREDANVPFKSFPGDNQSYKYHCRHGLFDHRDASYEVDRGWISHAQGGDGPVPISGTEDIEDIETDNDSGGIIEHNMLGAGGNIPKGPIVQDCDDSNGMGDIMDEPTIAAQQVDDVISNASNAQLSSRKLWGGQC